MPKHIRYECSGGHDYLGCQFCDGGLFACTVCGGFEGSLPTDCPGFKMTEEQEHRVYRGLLDYRDGREWGCPDGTGKSMGDVDVQVKEIKRRRDESIRNNFYPRQECQGSNFR